MAQLAISRRWPDSDIPQNLEQVKVIVNVVGASATSLIAALNRWHLSRITKKLAEAEACPDSEAMAQQVAVDATETTPLLGSPSGTHLKTNSSKERQVLGVRFTVDLNDDIDSAEDQMQGFAIFPPVTYPPVSFPDAGYCFPGVDGYDRLL